MVGTWDGNCPDAIIPKREEKKKHQQPLCRSVENWGDFVRIVETTTDTTKNDEYVLIVLCPFTIIKKGGYRAAEIRGKVHVTCEIFGMCRMVGGGGGFGDDDKSFVWIIGENAQVILQGLEFREMQDSNAIKIWSSTSRDHMICHCLFVGNHFFVGKGGALKTERGTTVSVGYSIFENNRAMQGGAIYNRGKMEVFHSSFSKNVAETGGAIKSSGIGHLDLIHCDFRDNRSLEHEGDAVHVDGGAPLHFDDAGGNKGSGNGECDGIYSRQTKRWNNKKNACHAFDIHEPPIDPPVLPPTKPVMLYPKPHPAPKQQQEEQKRRMPPGYFNYDMNDPWYGPNNWHKIDTTGNEWESYRGFDSRNQCGDGDDVVRGQSPIVLDGSWEKKTNEDGGCGASHQIRFDAGVFSTKCPNTGQFVITPTRLRINFLGEKRPIADLPNGYGPLPANFLEVTVPSLHVIRDEKNGKMTRYDGEYTIVHPQNHKNRIILISVLIDASGLENVSFQRLLDEWKLVTKCLYPFNNSKPFRQSKKYDQRKWHDGLRVLQDYDKNFTLYINAELRDEKPFFPPKGENRSLAACSETRKTFDIYHKSLLPSPFFYAYRGSTPEPPCLTNAHWRILTRPMKINRNQLNQIRWLLKDGPCNQNHWFGGDKDEGFARPLFGLNGRRYWMCGKDDFQLDCERRRRQRGRDGGRRKGCDCENELCESDLK